MSAKYINPALPAMIRDLHKSDPSMNSVITMLSLAADLVQELIDLRTILAEQGEPDWEYRCAGPGGEQPRPLAGEHEVSRHIRSGCGEVQRRKAGPWLPVPDTAGDESEDNR